MTEEAQRVFDAIAALEGITDPKERALAVGEVLDKMPDQSKRLRELRQQAVRELLAREGASYRKVATELGLHFTRVRDIAEGYSGSGKNRPKKSAEPDDQ